jgi:hypothetical protein
MIYEEHAAPSPTAARAAPAQNLWMGRQNQSPRLGVEGENPLRKMMIRPATGVRYNNETDCDGSFTAAPRTLLENLESPFSFHRHRSAHVGIS